MHDGQKTDPFTRAFNGYLSGVLRWPELDALWVRLRAHPGDSWFIYAVGETPPEVPASRDQLHRFIDELDALLRREHDVDYCGIVYVDDPATPSLVKVYDPNHLGSVCGSSSLPPPLPGWVLSRLPPSALRPQQPVTGSRRRWWQRLFG
jgi:hypothetical protein